jgi:MFS family permease
MRQSVGLRQALTLTVLGTMPTMALAALVAVLPTLFAHFAAAPHANLLVPMILTVPSLCVALFSAPIGAVADRWGRRPVLLAALVAFTVCGAVPFLFDDLYSIIASRFVVGIAEAAILTVGNALMGDYFDAAGRKRWLGVQMSIGPFVGSAYILMGGALATWSWHGPFLIYLLGAFVLAAAWATLFEPTRSDAALTITTPAPAPAPATGFPWRSTAAIGLVTIGVSIVFFLQAVQHGRIFSELGVSNPARISLIVTLASGGTVLGGWYYKSGRARRVSRWLALSLTCYGVAYIGIAFSPDYRLGLPFDALGQFGSGFVLPALIAWALASYPFEQRGRGMGIWAACFFLGQFLSPPVMTLIAHGRLGFLDSIGVLGGLCLAGAAWAALHGRAARA